MGTMWTLSFLSKLEWIVPLLLRALVGGAFFFVHGMNKVCPGGEWDWGKAFASAPIANEYLLYVAAWTEFLGGAAILLGLLTRWAALGITGVMAYAIFSVHWDQGFQTRVVDGQLHGFEFATAFAVASLVLVFTGPGPISVDRILFRKGSPGY